MPVAWNWVSPPPAAWGLVAAVAAFATAGQLLVTRAYALAPAAQVGPFTYSSVIFATVYGWMFWDEMMDLITAGGAALVVIAGVLTVRTRRKGERAPETVADAEPVSTAVR